MKRIAIHDANILIDLIKLDALSELCDLELIIETTDFVHAELKLTTKQQRQINSLVKKEKINVIRFSAEELIQLMDMDSGHSGISLPDCSVWYAAKKYNAIVLTGDSALRKKIEADGIEVHGILWVFDQLLKQHIISISKACKLITGLKKINKRLPLAELDKRVKKWCN